MTYEQLALVRMVLEKTKDGKKPSISHNQKVDLDYLHNVYDNLITNIEKEMKENPNAKNFVYRMIVNKK